MNNNLKDMASKAKERLKRGLYTNAEKTKAKNAMNINSYFIKNLNSFKKLSGTAEFKIINDDIDPKFVSKVYAILNSSEEIFNPIGRLIDNSIYSTLNDIQKQFYVLSVVDKYNKIKNGYNQNAVQKIG